VLASYLCAIVGAQIYVHSQRPGSSHGQGRVHGDAARQADGLAPGQFVAAKGADLFWWREQRLPPPEGIDAFLKEGAQIRDLLVNG
jgi:hypothetical protein